MGLDPDKMNPRFRALVEAAERESLSYQRMNPQPLPPPVPPKKKTLPERLERAEQHTFATWLANQEELGKLVYDWSRTDKRTTNRKGLPDFRIYALGRLLLGEFKRASGRLSQEQLEVRDRLSASGTDVQIWRDADSAIRATKEWLASL